MTGSEQKAIDYLLRHTYGYNKTADTISYSQFLRGIRRRKDGVWIDKGCGIKSSRTLAKALDGLHEKRFIDIRKSFGKTNHYGLKIEVFPFNQVQKVKNTSLENVVAGTLESKDTIEDITIENIQHLVWIKEYGESISMLIRVYGARQVEDAIKITKRTHNVKTPIAFITHLCKTSARWEENPLAIEEQRYRRTLEEGNKYIEEATRDDKSN